MHHSMELKGIDMFNFKICLLFSKKVLVLLILQLLSYNFMGFFCLFTPKIRFFIYNFEYMISITLVVNVIVLIFLHMKRKHFPANLVLLIIFTVVEACSVGIIITSFDLFSLLQTLLLTLFVMTVTTIYIIKSNCVCLSLTECCVLMISTIITVGILIQILLGSTTYEFIFSSIAAYVISIFLIYDIQRLTWKLHSDDFIFGTICLYFDIINFIPNILHKIYMNVKLRSLVY
ncbi:protein lifeguard 4-like isoform X2 [Daktulosphaira vitifoliae]|nr:protein lifeguard 4-like isoform X2 [Daktulosphaira vitifoliae]